MRSILFLMLGVCSLTALCQESISSFLEMNEDSLQMQISSFSSMETKDQQAWLFPILNSKEVTDTDASALLERLFEGGVLDVALRNRSGKLSLFDATITSGKYTTTKLVLEKGYNVDSRCFKCNAETPIHVILRAKNFEENEEALMEIAQVLVSKGADLDLRDMNGKTPFHVICDTKNRAAFNVFMQEDVEFNYQSATLKGMSYLKYFDKKWGDDELREVFMARTELKYPPTKKEIRKRQKENKAKQKSKKASAKKG